MKRVWIISDCEPLPCDDNPRLMRAGQLAEYLSANNWNVVWWAPGFNHGLKKNRFNRNRIIKVNQNEKMVVLYSLIVYKKNTSFKRIIFYKCLAVELKKSFYKNQKPDIIICSWPSMSFAQEAIKYGKECNVPVVLDVRDLWPDIFTRAFPKKMQIFAKMALKPLLVKSEQLFKKADAIVGVTPSSLKWGLRKAHRNKRDTDRVIYIGYKDNPDEAIQDDEIDKWRKIGVDRNTWNITYFGSFSASTLDMETCIKAFNTFSKLHDNARLILCGDGDAIDDFKKLAKYNEQIVFPGWCSNEQIQSLLSISNLGLYPFKNLEDFKDAFGNKIIGYMAAGLPVMSSLEGFSKQYIDKYNCGRVYKEGNVELCQKVMCEFYENGKSNSVMGSNSRKRFEVDFNMPKVNGQFIETLNRVIK